MDEILEQAVDELKRADHMIFVSLKYTRTCDVIKNIVERLISCFDFTFDYILEKLKEQKKIEEIPMVKTKKVEMLRDFYKENQEVNDFLDFYQSLRKINKAEFTRRQEFRRHVTMTAILDNSELVELNIDIIHDYYVKTKAFIDFAIALFKAEEQ